MQFVTNIGLEVHVELKTNSKLFCGCKNKFSREPNTNVCPVCLGYPGTLPVVNKKAVELLIKSALTLDCNIADYSKFDRKNYFYPDMPKNYQISQYDMPLAEGGYITVKDERRLPPEADPPVAGKPAATTEYKERKIRIKRIHLEEDTGKSIHEGTIDKSEYTLEDYNRAGVPLMEIVTEPDISTPDEAYDFLTRLKKTLEWIEVSDCKMEEGSLRCDANISVVAVENVAGCPKSNASSVFKGQAPQNSSNLAKPDPFLDNWLPNYKVEIKNMNSFKSVLKALAYEQNRQIELLKNNIPIEQCTRGWDEEKQITFLMRSKEQVHDYRYFPEPDLAPMRIPANLVAEIRAEIVELPEDRIKRFSEQYNLSGYDAEVLNQSKNFAGFFEDTVKIYPDAKAVCNWLTQDISKIINEKNTGIEESRLTVNNLVKMLNLIDNNIITGKIAKTIIADIIDGADPEVIIKEKGLSVISDSNELEKIVEKVLSENNDSAEKYKSGNEKVFAFLVGQVMKQSRGKADPKAVNEILKKKLM